MIARKFTDGIVFQFLRRDYRIPSLPHVNKFSFGWRSRQINIVTAKSHPMELSNLSPYFSFFFSLLLFLETKLVVFRGWNRYTRRGSFSIRRFTISSISVRNWIEKEKEEKKEIIFASDDPRCEATKTLASGGWLYQIFISTFRNDRKGKRTKSDWQGGGIDITLDHPRSPPLLLQYANRFVSRTYRFQLSPPDRRNSTINFASRKILFSFSIGHRPVSFSAFPSSLRSLSLSSAKIYSLLPSFARRLCFPSRSTKGKNLFLRSVVLSIDSLYLYIQPFKERKKEIESSKTIV